MPSPRRSTAASRAPYDPGMCEICAAGTQPESPRATHAVSQPAPIFSRYVLANETPTQRTYKCPKCGHVKAVAASRYEGSF